MNTQNQHLTDWVTVAVIAAMALLSVHWLLGINEWASSPGMNEVREQAQFDAVTTLLRGGSLYPIDGDGSLYLYGFIYPALSALLCLITGCSAMVGARYTATLFAIAVAVVGSTVVNRHVRGSNGSPTATALTFTAFAWLLKTFLNPGLGIASPGPIGVLLILLAVISARPKGGVIYPVVAASLTVVAFYTKPYFAAIFLPIAVWYAIENRRYLLLYAGVCVALGLVSVAVVMKIWPAYFVYTLLHHEVSASFHISHLIYQLGVFGVFWGSILVAIVILLIVNGLKSAIHDRYFIAFTVMMGVFILMGGHVGNFLTYGFQLWMPFAVVYVCRRIGDIKRQYLSIALMSLVALGAYADLAYDKVQVRPEEFSARLRNEKYLHMRHYPADSIASVTPLSGAINPAITRLDNGNDCYRETFLRKRRTLIDRFVLPDMTQIEKRAQEDSLKISKRLSRKKYRYVLWDTNSSNAAKAIIEARYVPVDTFHIYVYPEYVVYLSKRR